MVPWTWTVLKRYSHADGQNPWMINSRFTPFKTSTKRWYRSGIIQIFSLGNWFDPKNVGFLGTRFSDTRQMVSDKVPHKGKILDQKFSFRSCGNQEGYVECWNDLQFYGKKGLSSKMEFLCHKITIFIGRNSILQLWKRQKAIRIL